MHIYYIITTNSYPPTQTLVLTGGWLTIFIIVKLLICVRNSLNKWYLLLQKKFIYLIKYKMINHL